MIASKLNNEEPSPENCKIVTATVHLLNKCMMKLETVIIIIRGVPSKKEAGSASSSCYSLNNMASVASFSPAADRGQDRTKNRLSESTLL